MSDALTARIAALEDEMAAILMRLNAVVTEMHEAREMAREEDGYDERQFVMEMAA